MADTSERQSFLDRLQLVGIPASEVPEKIVVEGHMVVTGDPATSAMKPYPLIARDVAHLKVIAGQPWPPDGSEAGDPIEYPPPIAADRQRVVRASRGDGDALRSTLTPEEHLSVRQAILAYVTGDPAKVAPEWVDLANAIHFPMQLSAFAAEGIYVVAGGTYELAADGLVTVTSVYVEAGGTILVKAHVQMNVQGKFTAESRPGNTTPTIRVIGDSGANGANGLHSFGSGKDGGTGTAAGVNDKGQCISVATDGGTAAGGTSGGAASNGGPGSKASEFIVNADILDGSIVVEIAGGAGGKGGEGGTGQTGGRGGIGGAAAGGCPQGRGGNGGVGGTGGAGGNGGNGGAGSICTLVGSLVGGQPPKLTDTVARGGAPGVGGSGGAGGAGGAGSPAGTNGASGKNGDAGQPGAPGLPGELRVFNTRTSS